MSGLVFEKDGRVGEGFSHYLRGRYFSGFGKVGGVAEKGLRALPQVLVERIPGVVGFAGWLLVSGVALVTCVVVQIMGVSIWESQKSCWGFGSFEFGCVESRRVSTDWRKWLVVLVGNRQVAVTLVKFACLSAARLVVGRLYRASVGSLVIWSCCVAGLYTGVVGVPGSGVLADAGFILVFSYSLLFVRFSSATEKFLKNIITMWFFLDMYFVSILSLVLSSFFVYFYAVVVVVSTEKWCVVDNGEDVEEELDGGESEVSLGLATPGSDGSSVAVLRELGEGVKPGVAQLVTVLKGQGYCVEAGEEGWSRTRALALRGDREFKLFLAIFGEEHGLDPAKTSWMEQRYFCDETMRMCMRTHAAEWFNSTDLKNQGKVAATLFEAGAAYYFDVCKGDRDKQKFVFLEFLRYLVLSKGEDVDSSFLSEFNM